MKYAENNHALKVVEVCLKVGEMRDFVEEVTQKYWDYIGKGTIAGEAKIRFNRVPVSALCDRCEEVFTFDWRTAVQVICPQCGSTQARLITGTELEIENISILA